ncbi:MAG TPA: thiolase family protein [Nitriliruptorales bacterium]
MQTQRAAIVSGARTPIGKAGKAYADVHAVDLLSVSIKGALEAAGLDDPEAVEQVFAGCTAPAGDQAVNVARNGWLAAGLPYGVAATTLDTQCGSSQQAVNIAAALIAAGQADIVLATGIESTSRCEMGVAALAGTGTPYSEAQLARYEMPHQGIAGERIAQKYGVTREESDEFGLRSHLLSHQAWENGHFKDEAVFVERDGTPLLSRDEGIRPDSTLEKMATLKPVYDEDGIINAGSSSQLSDGSSAVLLASEAACAKHGLEPLAWIRRTIAVGTDPDIMLEGPIHAATKLLEREGLSLDDIDLFEVHEAYATVVQAWRKVHPVELDRINIDGGAIGQGHPFGASGARQIAHLTHALRRTGGRIGLQVMCCGGGIGTGTILEVA